MCRALLPVWEHARWIGIENPAPPPWRQPVSYRNDLNEARISDT
jgi:hypothetical protein